VNAERHSERMLILKMVLDNGLLNVLTVYAPHSGNRRRKKEFLERIVPLGELYTLECNGCVSGDMNGHVGSNNVGYDGMHGSYGFRARNADGSSIFEFADRLNLVICNTLFIKQESKLVTNVAGSTKSTVDYIIW